MTDNNKEDGYNLGERSTIFEYYVESFPDSRIGRDFRKNGLGAIRHGGGFRTALFEGDIQTALFRADRGNQIRLSLLLKDRMGYPIELTEDGEDYERVNVENGEKSQYWGEIMEVLRDNNVYPE